MNREPCDGQKRKHCWHNCLEETFAVFCCHCPASRIVKDKIEEAAHGLMTRICAKGDYWGTPVWLDPNN